MSTLTHPLQHISVKDHDRCLRRSWRHCQHWRQSKISDQVQNGKGQLPWTEWHITITLEGIRKQVAHLNPYRAPKTYIPQRTGRSDCSLINNHLSSFHKSTVPSNWKEACFAPVFKKGEHYNQSNYRPLSLTSIFCKIFKHIIVSNLMNHFEANILCLQQHMIFEEVS